MNNFNISVLKEKLPTNIKNDYMLIVFSDNKMHFKVPKCFLLLKKTQQKCIWLYVSQTGYVYLFQIPTSKLSSDS